MLLISACSSSDNGPTTTGVAPAITSTNNTVFTEGAAGTFTVMATGTPTSTLALTGTLPLGVTFDALTGVLSGTPDTGTSGTYSLTITASNGVSPDATQIFTLTVVIPAITSLTEVAQIAIDYPAAAICKDNYVYTVGFNSTSNSFSIVDMSDPTVPVPKGIYNIGNGYGLALNGNYAYIPTDGGGDAIFTSGTVGVMNITDPTKPLPVMQDNAGYNYALQPYYHNGYVYNPGDTIIGIYSVTDPAKLVPVTNITTTKVEWLALSGNYMYGVDDDTLRIWDITDPTNPNEIGWVTHADLDYAGIAVKGDYVFAMGTTGSAGKILVFDVSDKTKPTLKANLVLTRGTSPFLYEARILCNYLLISGEYDFYVVNIADPIKPVEITSIAISIPTPIYGNGWGFDVLNDRYAIVAGDTVVAGNAVYVYHVIRLW